ncbi:2-succinyl-6-hydroxy-2, 4-cyclohexadiene-1-carboxylate synthase [Klebsiella grimontii]|uniref:2-succinyl-6-hydroxy-2, 4-cyclohexadiene-1-carboxylate synthase n=1 Tax=Klebsiella grimontii TaxID=2058152 RepID=A0A7H4NZN9_9ENTR|nr:2-succinyl-6-hydroxy-2, 4-cyclohexadiene-1-carboxylate synthase [Klebsiella grimontii]
MAVQRILRQTAWPRLGHLVEKTLNSYNILKYWLVGYSLGGRVAMYFACQPREGLCGLVVEGGHPG